MKPGWWNLQWLIPLVKQFPCATHFIMSIICITRKLRKATFMWDGDNLVLKWKMWLIINDSYVLDCIFFFFLQLAKNYCDVIALFFWWNTSLPPHLHHSPSPVYKLEYRELYKIYLTVSKIYSWLDEHWKKWSRTVTHLFNH